MADTININGRSVKSAEDRRALEHLLNAFPETHDQDNNIDSYEAMRLLDRNADGTIDSDDLKQFLENNLAPEFFRAFKLFSNILPTKDEPPLEEQNRYFDALTELAAGPNNSSRASVDEKLKNISLRMVQKINSLSASKSIKKRYALVKDAGANRLYTIMVNAEEEIFTSSFNGLFNRFLSAMAKEEISGDWLLARLGSRHVRTFIKLCASYNRLNDFLETMPVEKQTRLLASFVSGLDRSEEPLSDAVSIADTFSMVTDPKVLVTLQTAIKDELSRVEKNRNADIKILYGILVDIFGENAVIDDERIRQISKRYKLPDLTRIPSSELFNPDGTNVQQYFFYGDTDGRTSFASFIAQYGKSPGWKIESHDTYVVISSVSDNGKKMEIYANKPSADGVAMGPDEIQKVFEERKIKSIVVVHRGHSYHARKTIARIPSIAKIVSLGSCGGYKNVALVLEKAPGAHIISTKGMGTTKVNEPIFYMLNEAILKGDIDWPSFWEAAKKSHGEIEEFKNYVPPHRNLGVLFLKAYFQMKK